MKTLREKTVNNIKERRLRALDGKLNCILSPFKRFRTDLVGIEKGTYITITSYTKGGKSQFTSYTFIYEPLLYCYYNKPEVKLTYLYFPLEEAPERIMERFMSFLIHRLTKGKLRVSPSELRSVDHSKPLSQEVLDIIDSKEFQDILAYFEEHVHFYSATNPTGIYKACKQYAEENGIVHTKVGKYKDDFGVLQTINVFDWYEPNNSEEYIIPIIDTLNLIDTEMGMTQKQSMDKMSMYCAKEFRNKYNMSPIVIQQQSFESEGNEAFKLGRNKPSVHTLGDSKYSARDANLVLGLNSPARFGLTEYYGYNISKLKDNVRFLEVLINRDGIMGGVIGLFFDGAVCTFKELPLPNQTEELDKIYKYVQSINTRNTGHNYFIQTINYLKNKYDTITQRKKCGK